MIGEASTQLPLYAPQEWLAYYVGECLTDRRPMLGSPNKKVFGDKRVRTAR